MSQPLAAGDPAPPFELPVTPRGTASLEDHAGKWLILFFYPKDDTEACTREASAFSALKPGFTQRRAALLGVSRDTLADHKAFIAKHGLKVRLGADEDGAVCEAFGVWQEKQLYGNRFMGIVRSTFLIDGSGVIQKVWRNVRVNGHAEAVMAEIEARR